MKRNMFDIFKQMNDEDAALNTQLLKISPHCQGGDFVKQGALVKMGIDRETFMEITDNKKIVLLLVVDKARYKELEPMPEDERLMAGLKNVAENGELILPKD